jgi:hypothetical protein
MKNLSGKPSKGLIETLAIIVLFIIITISYFSPVLSGKVIDAHDLQTWAGMSKEIKDFHEKTGDNALWTNALFGGMPSFQIMVHYYGNLSTAIIAAFYAIPLPVNFFLLNFIFFFALGISLRVSRWISFAGALAYGFTTFIYVLMDAGHVTKILTVSLFSLVLAGVWLAYNNRAFIGSLFTSLALALLIQANHLQMTYYAGIMILIMASVYFVYSIKEKTVPAFLGKSSLLVIAAIIAVGMNFNLLFTTYEYGKYTTRGKSDLIASDDNQTAGLNRDYILDYSYDMGEAVTAFIPRFKGGGMSEPLTEKSNIYKWLERNQGREQAQKFIKSFPLYWGSQPIAGGPFYYGAVLCFLFVLGLFLVKGKDKWWIAIVVVISFLLSLGKNIPWLANFMIDYFPGYSKFRDVKNIIVIQQFAMALLGILAIKEVYLRQIDSKKLINSLKYAFSITGGFALLFALFPGLAGNFNGASDAQITNGWPPELIDALLADRKMVLRSDSFRSFVFVAFAAAGIWAFWNKKLKAQYALMLWVVLILADLWPVNRKYLNNENFVNKRKAETPYTPTIADESILQDKDPNYRVLNLAVSTFNDTSTSYFHKSIGGYHGAKLKRYQEMIEHNISREMQMLGDRMKNIKSQDDIDLLFSGLNSINMLNTRYLIYNPGATPLRNPDAMGNCWFVENYMIVENANEEIAAVKNIDIETTLVVDKKFDTYFETRQFTNDSVSSIVLKSYSPNKLVYQSDALSDKLAVFSEIYYPKGWVVTIDGVESSHFRVNYILRSMIVPAGRHEIIFEFKPDSYTIGNKVSYAFSTIFILALAAFLFTEYKKRKKQLTNGE